MAYLRDIPTPTCCGTACSRKAKVELLNTWNVQCGKRQLAELQRIEDARREGKA